MAIYYKFKSARDYETISMDEPFISAGFLKEKIYETKHLGSGNDLDIVISNAQTNEEYLDEAMLIPKNTYVLIRRIPGRPQEMENVHTEMNNLVSSDASPAEDGQDEFVNGSYSGPDAPALDWQQQSAAGRMGGRLGTERKTPPEGYICRRCNVRGHFLQQCPTNGDPNYDVKRPTRIPDFIQTPSGAVLFLKPKKDEIKKGMKRLPSTTRSVGELPFELKCPLCREVMRDAACASDCCLLNFCDKCIRDHIIENSMCVCGATDVVTDDIVPNETLRGTIKRILESGNSSDENAGPVQDMNSNPMPDLAMKPMGPSNIPPPHRENVGKGSSRVMNNLPVSSPHMNPKSRQRPPPPISISNRHRRSESFSPERQSLRRVNSPPRVSSRKSEQYRRHDSWNDDKSRDSDSDRHRRSERFSPERQSSRRVKSPPRVSGRKSEQYRRHDSWDGDKSRERHRDSVSDRHRRSESFSPEHQSLRRVNSPPRVSSRKSEQYRRHDSWDDDKSRERHRESYRKQHYHRKRSEKPSPEPIPASKSWKTSPAPETPVTAVSSVRRHSRKETESAEHDSGEDEDRHFKSKPSKY